jgi:hypothetical protein
MAAARCICDMRRVTCRSAESPLAGSAGGVDALSEPAASGIGRRPIGRARVLVRKPHTQRRHWLIRAITVGTVRVERRHNMQPSTALTQEVVATRTTALDCAVNARVGVRNRRDAKKPQDNHRSHRDDNRPHDRSTLVQADMHIELNRRTPQGRGLRRSASAPGRLPGRPTQPGQKPV